MKRLMIGLIMLAVMLCGCGNITGTSSRNTPDNEENTKNTVTAKPDEVKEPVVKEADLAGTYVGLHGSGITFLSDGTAEYFWKEWTDVETGDKWSFDGKKIIMRSKSLHYDIYAEISGMNIASLTFQSDNPGWDDEIFVRVSDKADSKDVDAYVALIEKQLNISLNRPSKQSDNGEASGVSKELKEFLDGYEAFVDEYVEFMKQYQKNPTDLTLLLKYAAIMKKYADFEKALENYDSNKMSVTDSAYYLEVITRCTQKMIGVIGS